MNGKRSVPIIPARVTAQGLAEAIGLDVSEIQAVLRSHEEPDSPGDYLSADMSISAAKALGFVVTIEPRDLALECLYEFESRGGPTETPEGKAGRLMAGVLEHLESLDATIEEASEHWSVARMPSLDRNILRLGLYELEYEPDVSAAVIVSEAVRLAGTYSTEKSSSFVNGVLAALAKSRRPS
jgi:transcription antitermination factor NusB